MPSQVACCLTGTTLLMLTRCGLSHAPPRQTDRHTDTQPALHCGPKPCAVAFRTGKQYSRTLAQRTSRPGHHPRSRYRQRHQRIAGVATKPGRVSGPLGISSGHPAEPPRTERPQRKADQLCDRVEPGGDLLGPPDVATRRFHVTCRFEVIATIRRSPGIDRRKLPAGPSRSTSHTSQHG